MNITNDRIGGLIFLALSLGYGLSAMQIPMFPGDELEPFNARTLPYALAALGAVLSLLLLLAPGGERFRLPDMDWPLAAKLLLAMLGYGALLELLGFFLATSLFLLVGYWLLGERRPLMLLMCSFPLVAGFWLVLAKLLDIYLAPGQLFASLVGG